MVVLDHRLAQPAEVVLVGRLVRLLLAQRRVGLGQLGESAQREVELNRDRLLRPQRAVVVERGDAFLRGDETSTTLLRDGVDEVDDRLSRRRVVPGCEQCFVGCHLVDPFVENVLPTYALTAASAVGNMRPSASAAVHPGSCRAVANERGGSAADPQRHTARLELALEIGELLEDGDGEAGDRRGVEEQGRRLCRVHGGEDLAVGAANVGRVQRSVEAQDQAGPRSAPCRRRRPARRGGQVVACNSVTPRWSSS